MIQLLHSKTLTHLEGGVNQQSSSMTDILITVIERTKIIDVNFCALDHAIDNEHAQ